MKPTRVHFGALAVLLALGIAIATAHRTASVELRTAPTADVDPNAPAPASSILPFRAPCSSDAECATGTCVHFMDRGSFCSQPCTVSADCPASSTCNRKHFCK